MSQPRTQKDRGKLFFLSYKGCNHHRHLQASLLVSLAFRFSPTFNALLVHLLLVNYTQKKLPRGHLQGHGESVLARNSSGGRRQEATGPRDRRAHRLRESD